MIFFTDLSIKKEFMSHKIPKILKDKKYSCIKSSLNKAIKKSLDISIFKEVPHDY